MCLCGPPYPRAPITLVRCLQVYSDSPCQNQLNPQKLFESGVLIMYLCLGVTRTYQPTLTYHTCCICCYWLGTDKLQYTNAKGWFEVI